MLTKVLRTGAIRESYISSRQMGYFGVPTTSGNSLRSIMEAKSLPVQPFNEVTSPLRMVNRTKPLGDFFAEFINFLGPAPRQGEDTMCMAFLFPG